MVPVHFSDGVGGTVGEDFIKELDLFLPVPVGPRLAFGKHEGFSGVEETMDCGQIDFCSNLEDARQTKEVECRAASFQDKFMGGDEEGGFAGNGASALGSNGWGNGSAPQEIGIHFNAVDDAEDLALDNVKHLLPDCSGYVPKAKFAVVRRSRTVGGRGREPDLEELFWSFEGASCGLLFVVGHGRAGWQEGRYLGG